MNDPNPKDRAPGAALDDPAALLAALEELGRVHDVALEMIDRSGDVDALLGRVLDELERRLDEIPSDALDSRRAPDARGHGDPKLRGLVMFTGQAVRLLARARATAALGRRARELEEALGRAETANRQLDGVIGALDAAIVIADRHGRIVRANRAARALAGASDGELLGEAVAPFVRDVPRAQDGEVAIGADATARVCLVSRRDLGEPGGGEVVLLHDVTERDRATAERHRVDKMAELLTAVGVLAHHINNPLTALMGRAQLLRQTRASDPAVVKAATVIDESARRIAGLIRELAGVAKEGSDERLRSILERPQPPAAGSAEEAS